MRLIHFTTRRICLIKHDEIVFETLFQNLSDFGFRNNKAPTLFMRLITVNNLCQSIEFQHDFLLSTAVSCSEQVNDKYFYQNCYMMPPEIIGKLEAFLKSSRNQKVYLGFPWLLNGTLARNVINIVYIFCTLDTFTCAKYHVRSNFLWGRPLTLRLLLIICLKLFNIDLNDFFGKNLDLRFWGKKRP